MFDALDTLIDDVTVKSQALGSLEPVAIFLEQSVEGMHEYFRVFTAGHEQRAECLFDEVVDERAVDYPCSKPNTPNSLKSQYPLSGRSFCATFSAWRASLSSRR